jgi:hypothetical protein
VTKGGRILTGGLQGELPIGDVVIVGNETAAIAPTLDPAETAGAEAIDAGITTVVDWSHTVTTPAHADENVQALQNCGTRAVRRMRSELAVDQARVTMSLGPAARIHREVIAAL